MVRSPSDRPRRWHIVAALLFFAALPLRFHEIVGEDTSQVALLRDRGEKSIRPGGVQAADLRFVVWLVARNAYTLLNRPGRLFDAEPCHPAERALTLGEPGLTLGLLATPAWALSGDPLSSFHFALFATIWLAAYAMYLLVRAWTGNPVAGLVAGLLYGFHPVKTGNVVHPYIPDTAWTVLALFFATRLFERGRWRDALGLGVCMALQIGGSLYPLLGAAALAIPCLAWLVHRFGVRRLRPGPVLLALGLPAAAAAFVFTPYVMASGSGIGLEAVEAQFFAPWTSLLPWGQRSFGWVPIVLALAGVALTLRGNGAAPRWALLGGLLLAALLAAGGTEGQLFAAGARGAPMPPFEIPNLYHALARWLPGLDLVRAPARIDVGAHVALGALAGLGTAALLIRTPSRWRALASGALVAVAAVTTLGVGLPGDASIERFATLRVAPTPEALELFRSLEAAGDTGPVFDAPFQPGNIKGTSAAVLLSAYHHRRTSACSASFLQPETEELARLGSLLPQPAAARGLARLGFETVVVRHAGPAEAARASKAWQAQDLEGLRLLDRAGSRSAWSLDASRDALAALPNIVMIVSDDHGWPDFGFMGSARVHTPHIDGLAAEGVVFSHAFNSASTCRPSLQTLLTGLHPFEFRRRMRPDSSTGRRLSREEAIRRIDTLPRLLARQGYVSFQGGKYWEGSYRDSGFDFGLTEGQRGVLDGGGEASKALGRETMQPLWDFLESQRDVPFFVWFAPALPHAPFDASSEYTGLYTGEGAAAPYFANVSRLDARVGELLERLAELGLRERTLLVFLSDNGWDAVTLEESGQPDGLARWASGGLRGKASPYELGFRTPLVFSWPGVLPEGVRDDTPVSTTDLFATLLELASSTAPDDRSGRSLVPLLRGHADPEDERPVFGELEYTRSAKREADGSLFPVRRPGWFLRTRTWRYLWFPQTGAEELYRIDRDPFEAHDVAEAHPEVAARLRSELERRIPD